MLVFKISNSFSFFFLPHFYFYWKTRHFAEYIQQCTFHTEMFFFAVKNSSGTANIPNWKTLYLCPLFNKQTGSLLSERVNMGHD